MLCGVDPEDGKTTDDAKSRSRKMSPAQLPAEMAGSPRDFPTSTMKCSIRGRCSSAMKRSIQDLTTEPGLACEGWPYLRLLKSASGYPPNRSKRHTRRGDLLAINRAIQISTSKPGKTLATTHQITTTNGETRHTTSSPKATSAIARSSALVTPVV